MYLDISGQETSSQSVRVGVLSQRNTSKSSYAMKRDSHIKRGKAVIKAKGASTKS